MITQMFTVFDSKTLAYLSPFYEQSVGGAVRSFNDTCQIEDHPFHKYPEDFTLFHIGEFNNADCSFELFEAPRSLGVAIENIPQPLHTVGSKS